MKTVWLAFSLAGLVLGQAVPAQADCQCVAAGKRYHLGEIACISLPEGDRLARCSMVLNNSSWMKLHDSCPVGFDESTGQPKSAAHMVAPVQPEHDRPSPIHRETIAADQ
jgi:hypothetical protein